jgi:pteridine reductase
LPHSQFLRGQVALVTGAGARVGRALALALAQHGARVAVHYNTSAREANRVVAAIRGRGGKAQAFPANLRDASERAALIPTIAREVGVVRILVNNASLFDPELFADTTSEIWERNLEVNLTAPFHLSQIFAAQQNGRVRGHIINLSDWRGLRPGADHFAYTLTKAALIALSESTALALAPRIRVNCLALGSILLPAHARPIMKPKLVAKIPLRRLGAPKDVAAAMLYLLQQDFVTGATIVIDGGRRLVS